MIIAYPTHPRLLRKEGNAVVGRRLFNVGVSREKGPAVKNGGLLGAGPSISPPLSREGVAAVVNRGLSIAPLLSPPLSREGGADVVVRVSYPPLSREEGTAIVIRVLSIVGGDGVV